MDNADYNFGDVIDEGRFDVQEQGNKNYNMLVRLIVYAGTDYIEETGQTEVDYYLGNLERADPLKSFIDDSTCGLLEAAFQFLSVEIESTNLIEAILRFIVDHKNVKFYDDNIVGAAFRSEYVFFKCVDAIGNIHHTYPGSQFTALHGAVISESTNIVKYLLNHGIDVNCYNNHKNTPLHYACHNKSLDIMELLIQKEADLLIRDWYARTPLEVSIHSGNLDAAAMILNSKLAENLTNDILYASFCSLCRFFTIETREDSGAVLFINNLPETPEKIRNCYTVFKILWYQLLVRGSAVGFTKEPPLLSIYLNNNNFRSKNWFNALNIMLTSEIALQLIDECITYEKKSIFSLLIPTLTEVDIEESDRIEVLKLIVSMGFLPNLKDMGDYLSFNENDFRFLLEHLPDDCLVHGYDKEDPMQYLASVFCGLEVNLDYNKIFHKEVSKNFDFVVKYFTPALSNCSFKSNDDGLNSVSAPKILSLKEVSRNEVRKFIIKQNKSMSPKFFASAVHSLKTSIKIKNFIGLKTPLNEL